MASFDIDVVLGINWFFQLFRPLDTANRAIAITRLEDNNFNKASTEIVGKFWITPLVISFAIDSILFWYFNVIFQNSPTFLILYILTSGIQFAVGAIVLYFVLIVLRHACSLSVVIACYTVNVIYSPIVSLLGIPQLFYIYTNIHEVKIKHMPLYESMKFYFANNSAKLVSNIITASLYNEAETCIFSSITLLTMVITAECISTVTSLSRFKSYVSVCVASFIALLPQMIFTLAQTAIVASLMG